MHAVKSHPVTVRVATRLGSRLAALIVVAALSGAPAMAGKTLSVEERVTVAAPPAAVWQLIGNFGNLQDWHPAVATTTLTQGHNNQPGARRSVDTQDGANIVENLLAYDAAQRRMRYRIVASPLPVSGYVSTLRVDAVGGQSRIVWSSRFKAKGAPDAKAREVVAGIYRAGLDSVKEKFGQ